MGKRWIAALAAVAMVLTGLPSVAHLTQTGTAGAAPVDPATDVTKIPHYFGPYSNWANSPQVLAAAAVTIDPPHATPSAGDVTAEATATVDPKTGGITGYTVTVPGSGYDPQAPAPKVTITAPGALAATGAAASAVVSNGALQSVTVVDSGVGFVTPAIAIDPGAGTPATAHAVGGVDGLTINNGGKFDIQPLVVFGKPTDPNGVQATGSATMDAAGKVIGVTVADPGSGYTAAPSVTLFDGTLTGTPPIAADVTATIRIDSIVIDTAGSGYTSAPVVTITDAADVLPVAVPSHGASATANIALNGAVTAITVTSAGTGYFTPGLQKFVDTLPGLTPAGANDLGNYIPVAQPDTTTYPGTDYYEIGVVQYRMKFHRDLPPTLLRGYVQLSTSVIPGNHVALGNANVNSTLADTPVTLNGAQVYGVDKPHYLGPTIVAQKNKPVRILFRNLLPADEGGDLFLPVDTTLMGAGMTPGSVTLDANKVPVDMAQNDGTVLDSVRNPMCGADYANRGQTHCFTQNRAELHLHGGITPWISDGTPHQWVTPANDSTTYPKGVSVSNVPDMPDPGPGAETFFYTNQQSARLMFYHDHAWGITRLNVYAGEAAGYVIQDDVEKSLFDPNTGMFKDLGMGTPLIIQDKTFVSAGVASNSTDPAVNTDPTWDTARWGGEGSLWVPHVYMPAQNPGDPSGMSAFGRWMYGPWFWPPATTTKYQPIVNPYYNAACDPNVAAFCEPQLIPGTPNITVGMEAFNDTPVVNGTAYPTTKVDPKSYRFRILNAANDRFWNLQWYVADPRTGTLSEVALKQSELDAAQTDPVVFPTPDTTISPAGPSWIQIGTEGGFLPAPVVVPNQPTTWITDPTRFDVGNADKHSLLLAPAERADVIVDFSQYVGKTLILYNDAPAAFPARVPGYDYYTGDPDMTPSGAPSTLPGYGPNTRTIMQVTVSATPAAVAFDRPGTTNDRLGQLAAAFAHHADGSGVFEKGQDPIIVGQAAYNSAYGTSFVGSGWCNSKVAVPTAKCDGFARIAEGSQPTDTFKFDTLSGPQLSMPFQPKGMHDEMNSATFDEFGRMTANLGLEAPGATPLTQNIILYPYVNPATEKLNADGLPSSLNVTRISSSADGTQIWKITHNGVDTHPIHFHLYDVQVINRVTWDNIIIPPDPTELGWKDTVRVSPLEDTIVAVRPIVPTLPFAIPDSYRVPNPMMPEGAQGSQNGPNGTEAGFNNTDTNGNPIAPIVNARQSFDWEYVFHCHILSHEEMDMMRPVNVHVSWDKPTAPSLGVPTVNNGVHLAWVDGTPIDYTTPTSWTAQMKKSEIGFRIERAPDNAGAPGAWTTVGTAIANSTTYTDQSAPVGSFWYRVVAWNDSQQNGSTVVVPDDSPSAPQLVATGVVTVQVPSMTVLGTSGTPSAAGAPVTFTATVSDPTLPVPNPVRVPTGTVTFAAKLGVTTTDLGTVALDAGGVAAVTSSALPIGTTEVTATYSGDGVFLPSSDFLVQTVNPASSTTVVVSNSPNSALGQAVDFTATVGGPGATGTVTFTFDRGKPSAFTTGAVGLGVGQAATYTTSSLTLGAHTVDATYSGDAGFFGSTSTPINQVVGMIPTTTTLSSSANPSTVTQDVTFSATVGATGVTPTGSVTFSLTGHPDVIVPLNGAGVATFHTAGLPIGSYSVTASYAGTLKWAPSISTALGQIVAAIPTTTALTSSVNASEFTQDVTFTATVGATIGGTPTGSVTFSVDGVAGASVVLAGGQATFNTASLSIGSHTVTASYAGTLNWAPSSSGLVQHVGNRTTVTSLTTSTGGAAVTYPQPVSFTASVRPALGLGVPTGVVTFTVSNSNPGVLDQVAYASLDGVGNATSPGLTLTGGTNTVTAVYSANAEWLGSTSNVVTQVVNQAPTTLTMTRSASSTRYGQAVNFVATVSPAVNEGTVTFFENNGNPVKVPVINGVATWGPTGLLVGTRLVSAIFDGSVNYLPSNWASFNQTVRTASTTTTVYSPAVGPVALFGQTVTLSAQVLPVAPSTAVPTGTVRFSVDGVFVSGYVPLSGGVAWFDIATMRRGSRSIRAVYYPTPLTYNASTSPRILIRIL